MRDLVAGYKLFGDQRYLDVAVAYADKLIKKQLPRGYWATGYGNIFLADTGSALGVFITLYPHVNEGSQKQYFDAIQRYVTAIEKDGLIHPSGALGTGWLSSVDGKTGAPFRDEYTISSGLTGGEIFTWMYYKTKDDKYRRVAYNALHWILGTIRQDGVLPYVLAAHGSALGKQGDPSNDYKLWDRSPYLTSNSSSTP